jgi:elongation factor P
VPPITTNDLKNGYVLDVEGDLVTVVQFQHVKPGKGGAFVRTKLKNVLSGKVVDRTFNAGTKVETANVDKRTMQFLYLDGEDVVLMDKSTYEQVSVPASEIDALDLIAPSSDVSVLFVREAPFRVEPPTTVELTVTRTDPGVKGDTVSNVTKSAELETGAAVQVPLFVNEGDRVKVDTRTREYISRA